MCETAQQQKRIIITYNTKDLRCLQERSVDAGIIGVTHALAPDQLDSRLNPLLSENTETFFYGTYTALSKS